MWCLCNCVVFVCLFVFLTVQNSFHLYFGAWSCGTCAASRILHASLTVTLEISYVLPALLLQTISRSNEQLVKYAQKSCDYESKGMRWGFHMVIHRDDKQRGKVIQSKWYIGQERIKKKDFRWMGMAGRTLLIYWKLQGLSIWEHDYFSGSHLLTSFTAVHPRLRVKGHLLFI